MKSPCEDCMYKDSGQCSCERLEKYELYIKTYNQALEDFEMKIKECCSIVGSCNFEDMVKIKEQLKR